MPTPLDIFGVVAPAGAKLVAALHLPAGLATAAGTTVAGGTVTGTAAVPAGASAVYLGLAESPATLYGGSADVGGTALPDATTRPYTVEVRVVDDATDLTDYAALAAAFAASADVAYSRDVPPTLAGGFLFGGAWGAPVNVVAVEGDTDLQLEAQRVVTIVQRSISVRDD